MSKPRKSRRRASAGPVSILRQETITQLWDESHDSDVENERLDEEDEEDEAERRQHERRKRRRTLGDSPANRAPFSHARQDTLTQMGYVERLGSSAEVEGFDEREEHVKHDKSMPILEDETAGPIPIHISLTEYGAPSKDHSGSFEEDAERAGNSGDDDVLRMRLQPDRDNEEPAFQSNNREREIGDSDEEQDSELEDEEGDASRSQASPELGNEEDFADVPSSGNRLYDTDDRDDAPVLENGSIVLRRGDEVVKQEGGSATKRSTMASSPLATSISRTIRVQVRSSFEPATPQKRRFEIPDSDAESDFSPHQPSPATLTTSPLSSAESTPSRRKATLYRHRTSTQFSKVIASQSPITKASIPASQATTVDHTQYMQSQIISSQRTPTRKTLSREPTKTSPFVLRSSQLLTESQMLPASLMDSMPLPPRWTDSDKEDEDGNASEVDLDLDDEL